MAAIKKCPIKEGVRESGCDIIYSTLNTQHSTDRLTTNKTGNYKPLIMSSDQERANSESEQSLVSGISKSFSDEMSQWLIYELRIVRFNTLQLQPQRNTQNINVAFRCSLQEQEQAGSQSIFGKFL